MFIDGATRSKSMIGSVVSSFQHINEFQTIIDNLMQYKENQLAMQLFNLNFILIKIFII